MAASRWNELWGSSYTGGSARSRAQGRFETPPSLGGAALPLPARKRWEPPSPCAHLDPPRTTTRGFRSDAFMAPGATRSSSRRSLCLLVAALVAGASARGVASDAAADAAAQEATSRPSKEWRMLPLGYRPAHAVALQERIEEMWEARAGRKGEAGRVRGKAAGEKEGGEGAKESVKEEERRELEALNWAFSQLPLLEIPSDARLSDALRLLQKSGLMAAPVRDVAAREDAPLQQRYLGMVDGAGIVLWVMGQLDLLSLMLLLAMPHRPQVLPIVTYPPPPPLPSPPLPLLLSLLVSLRLLSCVLLSLLPTPSSLLSSSPSSSPPSSSSATFPASTSAEPAAAASSLGSETAPVPSLSALVSQVMW
ncbi:hypothetical protein CLOP_g5887 [Closterium sp. NIES-67]|nr:hypothetical protein CLOP_g5887 [Closterium sp. NIES-67]